jgi:hypothetical protein
MEALLRCRVRARPASASEHGRHAYGGYMELPYDPGRPWEVQLPELDSHRSVVFARGANGDYAIRHAGPE